MSQIWAAPSVRPCVCQYWRQLRRFTYPSVSLGVVPYELPYKICFDSAAACDRRTDDWRTRLWL